MKRLVLTACFIQLLFTLSIAQRAVDYIDPMIGTVSDHSNEGKNFPGATTPFGLVQLSPDTRIDNDVASGYSYTHNSIEGFSFLHLSGVGCFGEFGNLLVTPTVGEFSPNCGFWDQPDSGYRSRFSHSTEVAEPGYYSVFLDDYQVKSEMSVTPRSGILKFTFPESDSSRIQLDLAHRMSGKSVRQYVEVIDDQTIRGWMYCDTRGGGLVCCTENLKYTVYFYLKFSKPFKSHGIWSADVPESISYESRKKTDDFSFRDLYLSPVYSKEYQQDVRESKIYQDSGRLEGKHIGFFAEYETGIQEEILVKSGISFVSMEGAQKNLEKELGHWDFEQVREDAKQLWADATNAIEIEGATEVQKKIFYTALYHSMIDPRLSSDTDGRYFGADKEIHQTRNFNFRTVFSGWDTFRSLMPLMTIISPKLVCDEVNSLVEVGKTNGEGLPGWDLMGTNIYAWSGDAAVSVIVDAYMKGIRDFPVEDAFQLCVENALGPRSIRVKKEEFTQFGYVPCDVDETSITKTLEYCYADWCVAQFASELGRQELYEQFTERSKGYKHIYSAEAGFMRGRKKDGSWAEWNGKYSYGREGNVQEANIYNQHWFVPHDVEGLVTLMGKERFITQLDSLFILAPENFGHNEVGFGISFEHVHHVPYLFNIGGAPWLTQKWSRAIVDRAYGADPWGIPGNEDVGQMSAWYVLSAMGFHPVAPGNSRYQLGSPSFDKVTLKLDKQYYDGTTFTISAVNNSDENIYVQSVKLNGETLRRTWITHDEITAGGILEFKMGPYPALNYFDASATTQMYNP